MVTDRLPTLVLLRLYPVGNIGDEGEVLELVGEGSEGVANLVEAAGVQLNIRIYFSAVGKRHKVVGLCLWKMRLQHERISDLRS